MSTEAEKAGPTGRRGDPGASGPALALAQSGEDDDTDDGYYDTPSGNIWRPGAGPEQPPATNPAGPRRFSRSLIVRTWHPRPGRGSVRPDKETP